MLRHLVSQAEGERTLGCSLAGPGEACSQVETARLDALQLLTVRDAGSSPWPAQGGHVTLEQTVRSTQPEVSF